MKALVKAQATRGLWLEDCPVPEIGPDDVLIKVHKTGLCGTDGHIYKWDEWAQRTIKVPMIRPITAQTIAMLVNAFSVLVAY